MSNVVPLRPTEPPLRSSRELAKRLAQWSADIGIELRRNDLAVPYWRDSAAAQYEAGLRCISQAEHERVRDPEVHEALLGAASRYFLTAQVQYARARELGA